MNMRTKEELEWAFQELCPEVEGESMLKSGIKIGIAWADENPKASPWNSVDILPEVGTECVVECEDASKRIGIYMREGFLEVDQGVILHDEVLNVVSWMKIPR